MACSKSIDTDVEEVEEDGGISDYSNKNAPKKIESENIVQFTLIVEDDAVEDDFIRSRCVMEIVPAPGGFKMTLSSDRYHDSDQEGKFSKSKIIHRKDLKELQNIIKEQNLASINGHNQWNSALGNYLHLYIVYDSGETITAHGEGGCSVIPYNFNAQSFVDFFCKKLKIKQHENKTTGRGN